MRICTIEGCGGTHYGLGWCFKHYYRNYKHGSPDVVKSGYRFPGYDTLKESLEAKFKKGKTDECWMWRGAKSNYGYGSLTFKGKRYVASIVSYKIYIGDIQKGLHVCHKCDNPGCVNPNHLFLGTSAQNMRDMVKKGRSAKGENHSQAKLTVENVKIIKELLKTEMKHHEIAQKFNVKREAISKINQGIRWSHVK